MTGGYCPLVNYECRGKLCALYSAQNDNCAAVVIAESISIIAESMKRKTEAAEAAYRLQAELANPL